MPESVSALPVEFLFSMHLELAPAVVIPGGPHGTRVFVNVVSGTVSGPRVNATVHPNSGADWVHVRADGVAQLDVRFTMVTDDGAVIAVEYKGILDTGPDRKPRVAPLFQTGAQQYLWLNNVQAVGIGIPGQDEVTYDVYAVL